MWWQLPVFCESLSTPSKAWAPWPGLGPLRAECFFTGLGSPVWHAACPQHSCTPCSQAMVWVWALGGPFLPSFSDSPLSSVPSAYAILWMDRLRRVRTHVLTQTAESGR